MKNRNLRTTLALTLTALAAGPLHAAADARPQLQDYSSPFLFLQALQQWTAAHPDGVANPTAAPAPVPATPAPAVLDPTSELAPPPFEITGPENLAEAVAKARGLTHPHYTQKIRYHRSTHLSFPLRSIDGDDMSQASIANVLGQGGAVPPMQDNLARQINKTEKEPLEAGSKQSPPAITTPPPTPMLGDGIRSSVNINVSGR